MSQLFFRRHYETVGRVLGTAHYHSKSAIAEQTIDLIMRIFVKVFSTDSRAFRADLFKTSVLRAAADLDEDASDPAELTPEVQSRRYVAALDPLQFP